MATENGRGEALPAASQRDGADLERLTLAQRHVQVQGVRRRDRPRMRAHGHRKVMLAPKAHAFADGSTQPTAATDVVCTVKKAAIG